MRKSTWIAAAAVLALSAGIVWSVSATYFEVAGADGVKKGTLEGVVLSTPGGIELARERKELLKADGEIIWSLAMDPAGDILAGSSQKGRIYRIRGDKTSVEFETNEAGIFTMAVGPDGKLYAAGGPSGIIYKDGKPFCKLTQSYVWALMFDERGGLYAATGPDGKVFRIDAVGTPAEVLDSPDPHILCLARDSKGNVYAGSSKSGLVYEIPRAGGSAKVIYDAAEGEIRSLVVDDKDNVYFGTADVAPGRTSRGSVGVRAPRPAPTEGGDASGPAAAPAPIRDDVTATNAIYRLAPDGSIVQIYSVRGKMILALAWAGDLYAGTGNRGDFLCIDANLDVTKLEDDMEKQITSLLAGRAGEIVMGTGDQGRVYRYAKEHTREGQFTSEVFDAKFPARFGAATWQGAFPPGTSVELATQSGNVAEPDATWSDWSAPLLASGQSVTSPAARFIRYRLKLKTALSAITPVVDSVKIACLAGNQPPRVKAVKVSLPEDKPKDKPAPAQVDLSWQAEDPNGDTLEYRLEFRMRGDNAWRALEEKTDKVAYAWKTDAVPDGIYEVRVTASDAPDNPKDSALTNALVANPFPVDNTRPTVVVTVRPGDPKSGKAFADVVLTDVGGTLASAEYSLDSGDWQAFAPEDRIYDSAMEKATIALDGLADGEHTLTTRATDGSLNVGAGSRTFTTK